MTTRLAGTALAALALLLTGCSQTVSVQQDDLEKELSQQLEATVGQAPDKVECPGDLEGKEGTEMRCTLTAGSDELGMTVTVTSVDGKDVKFDFEVDDQ